MTKDDILRWLEFFGFSQTRVFMEQPDHPNGPAFAVIAGRAPRLTERSKTCGIRWWTTGQRIGTVE